MWDFIQIRPTNPEFSNPINICGFWYKARRYDTYYSEIPALVKLLGDVNGNTTIVGFCRLG
jgi:hypothetical protein